MNEYDREPVKYCTECFSLLVGGIDGVEDSDYCMACGCTKIGSAGIREWERMYEARYGHRLVERERDAERGRIFSLGLAGLKGELLSRPRCREIVGRMYPALARRRLPEVDLVFAFFDEACKDGRLDELRELLSDTKWK